MYVLLHTRARLWCGSYMSRVYERTNNERISFEVGIYVCARMCVCVVSVRGLEDRSVCSVRFCPCEIIINDIKVVERKAG